MITSLGLIRNVGVFNDVNSGSRLPLKKFALVYAENGRGKTTLAAILRSLASGDPSPILERRRLGAQHPPHVVIYGDSEQQFVFQNDAWTGVLSDIVVFDDYFVAENVCSGMEVESVHRQNLHELIIGAQGVALNAILQGHINRIEQHNRDLQAKGNAIPAEVRGRLSADEFCALENRTNIAAQIQAAERNLSAARQADQVRQQSYFQSFSLPELDLGPIEALLARDLPELEAEAAASVQEHLAKLGDGGEAWASDGVRRVEGASKGTDYEVCPFCAQNLSGSPLIRHYQAYFSAAYGNLKRDIASCMQSINSSHSGEIQTAFERSIRVAEQTRHFWKDFAEIPEISIDTVAIALSWKTALEAVSNHLQAKQASPLDHIHIDGPTRQKVESYQAVRHQVSALSDSLARTRAAIDLVKESTAAADVPALESDLACLRAVDARYRQNIAPFCDAYLQEKADKTATKQLRDTARANLDQYRNQIFPDYENDINNYLRRFNAGFRLDSVTSANTRAGSTCNYTVLIDNVTVPLASPNSVEPSFKNTLSAGDRNALALAFFFASLERDPNRNQKIVIIDDPMTSLDEHRSLTTIQEMGRLAGDVAQLIVLSHSKPFLCGLWQGPARTLRSACKIVRSNHGSTLDAWDVNQDCITEHDRRHATVRDYIQDSVGADERAVAAALRPILEAFARVAFPESFPPGTLLGPFISLCQRRLGTSQEILRQEDLVELRSLLDYANLFHHDTNAAWQTVDINDGQLLDFARRTLDFATR